jgi:GDP-mannose 6-dehydrogenase
MKVAVVGLGYFGTVTAACMATNGHDVWGVDVDAAKVDEIRVGRSPAASSCSRSSRSSPPARR